jgi:hypothetical protein
VLQRRKVPETEATLVCYEPGLWAGMSVALTEAQWGHDQTMRIIRVVITAVDPEDEAGQAYLRSELTLNNKPKRRSPKIGRPEETTADTAPRPIDDFDREATPPTPTPGDAISVSYTSRHLSWSMVGSWSGGVYTPGVPTTPAWKLRPHPAYLGIHDQIGIHNEPWVNVPCGTATLGAQDGWREQEAWLSFTMPALPAGTVGIYATFGASTLAGAAIAGGIAIRASATQPTAPRSAPIVGHLGAAGGQVYVPASLLPAEGQTMWLGITAGWAAQHDFGWYCYSAPPAAVATSGSAGPGSLGAWSPSLAWAEAVSEPDLGSTAPMGDATEGNAWQVTGVEDSPTYGIDGEALTVTGGGIGISVTGPGEDDDAEYGAWSEPSAITVEFSVSALDAGSIEVTTVNGGGQTVGTLSLDDPASITVAGPTSTDTAAFTLTANERYRATFDTRSGELVGKIWRVSDGEPADPTVISAIDLDGDMGDRLVLWLRAGAQTVRIHSIEGAGRAESGERVEFEWIGFTSGLTEHVRTRNRHREGTLVCHVNGIDCSPVATDGVTARLDAFPTTHSMLHATYIAD